MVCPEPVVVAQGKALSLLSVSDWGLNGEASLGRQLDPKGQQLDPKDQQPELEHLHF